MKHSVERGKMHGAASYIANDLTWAKKGEIVKGAISYIVLVSLTTACGTVTKSSQKSPVPETQNTSESKTPEAGRTNYPYGDLIEHAQLFDGGFLQVCETAVESQSCESYRVVKAYYPTAEDKAAAESGQFKKTCEQPQGAADQNCELFRVEKSSL